MFSVIQYTQYHHPTPSHLLHALHVIEDTTFAQERKKDNKNNTLHTLLPHALTPSLNALPHLESTSTSGNEEDDDGFRKRKKPRTAFSREQVSDLEKKFQEKKYLSSAERGELAEKLKLSDMQVCLSVSLSVCQPACLSVCLSVCQPACLSVCLSVCQSVHLQLSILLAAVGVFVCNCHQQHHSCRSRPGSRTGA